MLASRSNAMAVTASAILLLLGVMASSAAPQQPSIELGLANKALKGSIKGASLVGSLAVDRIDQGIKDDRSTKVLEEDLEIKVLEEYQETRAISIAAGIIASIMGAGEDWMVFRHFSFFFTNVISPYLNYSSCFSSLAVSPVVDSHLVEQARLGLKFQLPVEANHNFHLDHRVRVQEEVSSLREVYNQEPARNFPELGGLSSKDSLHFLDLLGKVTGPEGLEDP
ncbi:hypothetical protein HAZT_HAZT005704, partial [Hyalella azteca]